VATYTGSGGAELHYDELNAGEEPTIVALAGGAARHPSYLGDLAGLPARLMVPHLRGVGRSPLPQDTERASYWRQADDLDRLRVALGLERLNLLGHSAGTRLAMAYALQYPERLASLVLITPPAASILGVPSDADELIAKRRGEPEFDAAVDAWERGPGAADDDGLTAWYAEAAPMSYAVWNEAARKHTAEGRVSYAANRAYFSVAPPEDLARRLATVAAPVMVMGGAEDCGTGIAPVAALAELFPDVTYAVVSGSGHYPWVEQPDAFRAEVERFYARCASS
jgi:pimeloyl-ACP methyl ester carboxylesterase